MVLKKIRKENEIEEELKEIEEDIVSSPVLGLKGTLREMCTRKVLVRLMANILLCTVHWPYVLYKYCSVCVSTAWPAANPGSCLLCRLTIGALVQLLQQSTGINVIMYSIRRTPTHIRTDVQFDAFTVQSIFVPLPLSHQGTIPPISSPSLGWLATSPPPLWASPTSSQPS